MIININTDNAAFDDADEMRNILATVADKREVGFTYDTILDSNGNTVGWWSEDGEE